MPSLAPQLARVGELARDLPEAMARERASAQALWQVKGPPTSGKSALIEAIQKPLRERGFVPIVVAPPQAALDAGPLALLQIGSQLHELAPADRELAAITERGSWGAKYHAVRSALCNGLSDKVVLLCDEPLLWPTRNRVDFVFASRAHDMAQLVMRDAGCRRLVVGEIHASSRATYTARLQPASDPEAWLNDESAWGSLAPAARSLWSAHADQLRSFSPLDLRLLVAHVAIGRNPNVVQWISGGESRRSIARELWQAFYAKRMRSLLRAWGTLALVRTAITGDILQVCTENLSGGEREILEHCLLYPTASGLVLHETLRADARAAKLLGDDEMRATHGRLADCYQARYASSKSLMAEAEALYHATGAADPDRFARLQVYFVEQLDAFGRSLSLLGRRQKRFDLFQSAAEVFRRSLEWDPNDDYAHHYLAFNLDVQGRDAMEVEQHYGKAIDLASRHPWWHSRYITFLITRGRTDDARRAWDQALDALVLPDPNADPEVYEELHIWVARLLIHRGDLDFARQVLDGIPNEVREGSFGLAGLGRRLEALLEARRMGALVPGPYLQEGWWREGPFRLERQFDGFTLTRWVAARIDRIDSANKKLCLRVATVRVGNGSGPELGELEMDFAKFDKLTRDQKARELSAGRFVEIGVFSRGKAGTKQYARVHPEGTWSVDDLPPLYPDPSRYLRKAALQGLGATDTSRTSSTARPRSS